jgi:tetratricopeptide (TPR) repeat protein
MINPNKPEQVGQRLPMWTSRAVALFFSLLLLSESTVASVGSYGLKIAQQPATNPSVPLSPDKQQRYQEGVKLYQEGQELYKKGTKQGYQQAIEKYQQALKIAQEIGLRQEEAFIYHSIGTVYFLLSDNKNALSFYKQALTIWEKLNQPVDKAAVQYSIGQAHANVGEYNTALEYYQKAELVFREKQEFFYLSRTLRATALAYIRLGNMDKALNSLNQALGICRNTLKDSVCEANILNSIGLLYSQKLDSKAAFENYNQALEIRRKNKDLSGQAETLTEMANLMSKLGKHKEALQHLEEAQKLLQGKGTPIEQGLILDGIGDVYSSLGDFQKAVNYHKQSRILFSQAG